jgi:DNA-binding NarL/FixJ family response regulator
MSDELTVYIVDDSPLVRERLIETIAEVPNARVVGEAIALREALEGVRTVRPRVLILDIQLQQGSGLLLLKQIRAARTFRPELVIIVTNYPTDAYRQASRECGADHFFDKASEFDRVRDVLIELGNAA